MSGARRALAVGAMFVAAYAALAALSGHQSLLARRPLLDGIRPPLPYNWVSPPPRTAASNKSPSSGRSTIPLNPQTGSEVTVFSTKDLQVSVVFNQGAFPPVAGQDSVLFTITPLAQSAVPGMPSGATLDGNVYRIEAALQPSGQAVKAAAKPGQLAMVFPPIPDPSRNAHTVYFSEDGTTWRPRPDSIESLAQLQATSTISSFGYYAVATTPRAGGPLPTINGSRTNLIPTLVIVALVLVVAFFVVRFEFRERRARQVRRAAGGTARRGKPPPRRRDEDW